ncbi:uncharacterized protein LOC143890793 isoform X1 [Tasmannia lanceolata]|uniref:uncharacterized protein LOC143890793 isoform X1 n=1 Tax=Tasmannia lanceolata TaxID=3420 RepID=UPI0040641CD1
MSLHLFHSNLENLQSYWRSIVNRTGGNRWFATSTAPNTKSFARGSQDTRSPKRRFIKGEYVPVYVVLGMILLSVSLGAHTAKQQLKHSPGVHVSKKKRETLPELVDPDDVAKESENFVKKSFFRRVAHVQDSYKSPKVSDPTKSRPKVVTLKSVGVETNKD